MKEFIKQMLSGLNGNISSKRVCGVLGWLVILGVYIYCTIKIAQAPDITEVIIWASVTLLGVDSVTNGISGVLNRKNKTNEDN